MVKQATRSLAWQLIWVWAAGSVVMGTVAVVFLRPQAAGPPPGGLPPGPVLPGADSAAPPPITPLPDLSLPALLAVLALLAGLFAVLMLLAWRTASVSWLAGGVRGWLLWAALVGGIGLAGWFFAATVGFAVGFTPLTLRLLAYLPGGLPFALAAALLQRPWRINLAAAAAAVGLLISGYVLVARQSEYSPNVFTVYLQYLLFLFQGRTTVVVQL
jgi:hypothetical protein